MACHLETDKEGNRPFAGSLSPTKRKRSVWSTRKDSIFANKAHNLSSKRVLEPQATHFSLVDKLCVSPSIVLLKDEAAEEIITELFKLSVVMLNMDVDEVKHN